MFAKKHIVIVGAGIGGLVTAIRLATKGHTIQLIERLPQVGGKLNQITKDGFSFDTGPSLITMPYVLQELFQAADRRLEDYLELKPLDITCRYFYRDGIILNAWRDQQRFADEIARINEADGQALHAFFSYAQDIFKAAADPFLYHSLGSPFDIFRTFTRYVQQGHGDMQEESTVMERLRAVLAALSPATLDRCVHSFFTDEHLRQLFDRYATYNGSSPYQVASVYSIIPYVEMADGGWYTCGGIYALAQALEKVARELGVEITTSCAVKRILVEHGAAQGVVLEDGRIVHSDLVVANSDVVTTHRELLSPVARSQRLIKRLEGLEPSCSGFVLMLGTDKQYPELAHHNIFFSNDYPAEFEDLFQRKTPIQDPTIYICATTRTDASQAPVGHENLFILVNAPYLTEASDWEREAPMYRERILDSLGQYSQIDLSDLREHIVCEEMLTPVDIQQRYGANAGSIYGLSSNQRMAPFTRPGNRSSDIRGLYFVGGSTHPGGGVPLVMLSGKIVADLIEDDIAS